MTSPPLPPLVLTTRIKIRILLRIRILTQLWMSYAVVLQFKHHIITYCLLIFRAPDAWGGGALRRDNYQVDIRAVTVKDKDKATVAFLRLLTHDVAATAAAGADNTA